jgi:hypothetical protein
MTLFLFSDDIKTISVTWNQRGDDLSRSIGPQRENLIKVLSKQLNHEISESNDIF